MREVLTRRFTHGLKEREENGELGKFTVFPDLILMDGGKGQERGASGIRGPESEYSGVRHGKE